MDNVVCFLHMYIMSSYELWPLFPELMNHYSKCTDGDSCPTVSS